jgi:hypothetical protein
MGVAAVKLVSVGVWRHSPAGAGHVVYRLLASGMWPAVFACMGRKVELSCTVLLCPVQRAC